MMNQSAEPSPRTDGGGLLLFRAPCANDGTAVDALVRRCPPLDVNSLYCHLLQCTHFADTCVVAESEGVLVGWISAYRLPADPRVLFIWQVAVAPEARGAGLGIRMLDHLVARDACAGVEAIAASVTPTNAASLAMFGRFAKQRGIELTLSEWFDRDAHFDGRHESEMALRIGPFHSIRSPIHQEAP